MAGTAHSNPGAWRATAGDLFALTLAALVVNCFRLGDKSVWLDEATSVEYALMGWRGLRDYAIHDPNSSFYYAVLSAWTSIFGTGDVGIRLLSALLTSSTVPLVYLIGVRMFDRVVAVVGALLFAGNAFVVSYAQMARGYGLLLFLTCLASWFLAREIERPARSNRLAYVAALTLAFYVHVFAGFVLVAHALFLVISRGRAAFSRRILGTGAAVAVLCAPMLLVARTGRERLSWIGRPSLADLRDTAVDLAGGSPWFLAALVAGGVAGLVLPPVTRRWRSHLMLACWMLAPILLSFVISQVTPVMQSQYLIVCIPALSLWGASALAGQRWPRTGVLILVFAALGAGPLRAHYSRPAREDWRSAVSYIRTNAREGDALAFVPDYVDKPFRHYMPGRTVTPLVNLEGDRVTSHPVVWVVISPRHLLGSRSPALDALRGALSVSHRLDAVRTFPGIEVERYVR